VDYLGDVEEVEEGVEEAGDEGDQPEDHQDDDGVVEEGPDGGGHLVDHRGRLR